MKNFNRKNRLVSLCGLNCGLCPMYIDHYCPGCGGGPGNQSCAIARCSMQKGNYEYCFQCDKYPCEKYNGIDKYDSFVTHRNQLTDMKKIEKEGEEKYLEEQGEKAKILARLLENYNDGRRKSFFCVAVNLLDIFTLRSVMEQIEAATPQDEISIREKAAIVSDIFQSVAREQNVALKLTKKPK